MIQNGNTVKVHYTGRLVDGQQFDSSYEREPLQFTVGSGQVIPGFEKSIMGKEVGEKCTINIPVESAYGPHNPALVMQVEKSMVPEDVEIGDQLESVTPDGKPFMVRVVEKMEDHYVLDANHPLAGQSLVFDIEVVDVQ